MAYQQYLKNAFLDDLKEQIKEGNGLELYFEDDFPIPEDMVQVIPQIKLPEGLCEKMDPKNELSSAIELYRAYKNISPIQATDTYFWESLAHTNLFRYVKQRWPISPDSITPDYIIQHWFVSSSANVSRHSLASLWWPVYLTIDEDLDNPFELTEVLFRNQTFRTRTYGTSLIFPIKEANMGILRYIKDHPDLVKNFEKAGLEIYKHFNRLGASKQLAAMDRRFFYSEMQRAHNNILEAINNPN